MRALWIQCHSSDQAWRMYAQGLAGGFNGLQPMPCELPADHPTSVNIAIGDHPVNLDWIRKWPHVVAADIYDESRKFPDLAATINVLCEQLTSPPPGSPPLTYQTYA